MLYKVWSQSDLGRRTNTQEITPSLKDADSVIMVFYNRKQRTQKEKKIIEMAGNELINLEIKKGERRKKQNVKMGGKARRRQRN